MAELLVALLRGGAVERGAVHGVDEALDLVQALRGDLAEIGPFGKPAAQNAVAVLHAALLVGGIGPGVEDLRPEGPVESVLVEKLAAVVRDDAADLADALRGPHAADGPDDALLVDAGELLEPVAARKPVVDDEDASAAAGARDDRVALDMSGRGRGEGLGGELLEFAPSQDGSGRVGRIALALVLAAVGQVVVRQADVAAFALAKMARTSISAAFCSRLSRAASIVADAVSIRSRKGDCAGAQTAAEKRAAKRGNLSCAFISRFPT